LKILFLFFTIVTFVLANVGVVVDVVGNSTLIRDGKSIKVVQKLKLKEHDKINTGNKAKVKLFFKDDTAVSLGKNTSFEIDSYIFTNDEKSDVKFKVVKGFFKAVTGKIADIAPQKFKLQTKTATIGIRGTVFAAEVGNKADVVYCTDGTIVLFTPQGSIEVRSGKRALSKHSSKPKVRKYTEKEKIELIENAGWHGSMSLNELVEFIKNNFKEPLKSQLLGTIQNILNKDSDERKKFQTKVTKNADEIGFIDDITINGREFDSLQQREIEFYSDDLKDGKVTVAGLLESEDKAIPVDKLFVEVTTDGGDSWSRAKGHDEWEWTFEPKVEHSYEFALRVVQDSEFDEFTLNEADEDSYNDDKNPQTAPQTASQTADDSIARSFMIGGFELLLDESAVITDDKISGSGKIVIPYLENFSLSNEIDVNFDNLSFEMDSITLGDIHYNQIINISTDIADIAISKITISAIAQNNSVEGTVNFKGFLNSLPSINIKNTSTLLPSSFNLHVPVESKTINIWSEKGVKLSLNSGFINISYEIGDQFAKLDMSSLNAQVKFGTLITNTSKTLDSVVANLSSQTDDIYTLNMQNAKAYLLGEMIELDTFDIGFDISDFNSPSISFNSSIDFSQYEGYDSFIIKMISNSSIASTISKDGFFATITSTSSLEDITILDRGSDDKNVRLVFNSDEDISFGISISGDNDFPQFDLSGISANIEFGDILQSAANTANGTISKISAQIDLYSENKSDLAITFMNNTKAYILGTKFAIEGINSGIKLNLETKKITISSLSINLDEYTNPILQKLSGSKIDASISSSGFDASITADGGIDDIVLLDRGGSGKDVVLNINGTPSIGISISENGIDFDYGELEATVDFGDTVQASKNSVGNAISHVTATLKSIEENVNDVKKYKLSFPNGSKLYLLGTNFALSGLDATLNLNTNNIKINSGVDLSDYSNPILNAMKDVSVAIDISPTKFEGLLTSTGSLDPITILSRGDESQNVRVEFSTPPTVRLNILSDSIDFGFTGGSAKLYFGDLLQGAVADLEAMKDKNNNAINNMYTWHINGSKKLINESELLLSSLAGKLDLSQLSNPSIVLNASADLSKYEGIFKNIKSATISNATITKSGLSASFSTHFGNVDLFKEEGVKLNFTQDPTINIELTKNSFDIGFSDLHVDLDFGTLLSGAVVKIDDNGWSIDGIKKLVNSDIELSNLSGLIDFSDFTNPSITLNASADLHEYGKIFEYVTSAELQNSTISKNGLSATLVTGLRNIDIWKDKNVKIVFDPQSPPEFTLDIDSSGLRVGVNNLNADLYLGNLLNDATAQLENVSDTLYSWQLTGEHVLGDSQMVLKQLGGNIDLGNLKDPIINLNTNVDLSAYGGMLANINSVALQNSTISTNGFKGDLNIALSGFDIWSEKNVKVIFASGLAPTIKLNMTRDSFDIGVENLNAQLAFGDLFEGNTVVSLTSLASSTMGKASSAISAVNNMARNSRTTVNTVSSKASKLANAASSLSNDIPTSTKGIYRWSIPNTRNLTFDDKGYVVVSSMGGTIDLNNLLSPIVTFDASANFDEYELGSVNPGTVSIEDATISKSGVNLNMFVQGMQAEFTILDLGSKNDDVRIELFNIDGSLNSQGEGGVDNVDGTLFFGKLFDGDVEPITLSYQENGHYSFNTSQVFTYTKDDNSIVLSGLSGDVRKIGNSYEVSLTGDSQINATILSAIGLNELSINSLKISSSGLAGDIQATFSDKPPTPLLGGKVKVELNEVGVRINSADTIPFKLTKFDGYLDLSPLFREASNEAKALLSYSGSQITWSMSSDLHIGNSFVFKNLSGSLDFESLTNPSIGLNGIFSYEGIDTLALELSDDFQINRSGISGAVSLANGSSIPINAIEGLKLTQLSARFSTNIGGTAGLIYDKNDFLGSTKSLHLGLQASINSTGINSFTVDMNNIADIDIPNFALLSFTGASTSTSFDNFFLSLNGSIKPDNPLFSSTQGLEFRDLKISRSGISVGGAGAEIAVSGASATLGGFGLNIDKMGIGFIDSKFYVSAKGALTLADLAEAGAGVKLYSNGEIDVESIKIRVTQPGASFSGDIAWKKDDPIYGNYFGTDSPLNMMLAGVFSLKGEFKVGTHNEKGFYWMAKAQGGLGGGGIPLGPLSIYELGGGVAYNMSYTEVSRGTNKASDYTFIPSGSKNGVLILSSLIGTPDLGFTWHGQLELSIDSSGQIDFDGNTYILSAIGSESNNRKVSGHVAFGIKPTSLHITAAANITFFGIGLNAPAGSIDILFNGSEKHVYLGTSSEAEGFSVSADNPIGIELFGLDGPNGYFMIDTRQLAFGMGYHFYKKWSLDWWGPDPWASATVDADAGALMRYNPFYMKMYANASAEVRAGYSALRASLTLGVDMELVTPSPDYLWAEVYVVAFDERLSFGGYVYGKNTGGGSDMPNKLLFDHIEPYIETDMSIMPRFKVVAMHKKSTRGGYSSFSNIKLINKNTSQEIPIHIDNSYLTEVKEIIVIPKSVLAVNTEYVLKGTINYDYERENEHERENFSKSFKTQAELKLDFNEIVQSITPEKSEEDVIDNTPVIITYTDIVKYLGDNNNLIGNYRVTVSNSKNIDIDGSYIYDESLNRSVFIPSQKLRIYHYCVRNNDGSIMETYKNEQGQYLNPFKNYTIDGTIVTASDRTINTVPPTISRTRLSNVSIGRFVRTVDGDSNEDTTYSYFTNNTYNITVTDLTSRLDVYVSSFSIAYADVPAENVRKFEDMSYKLNPRMQIQSNENRNNEKRFLINSDLSSIGIGYRGVSYYIKSKWITEGEGEVNKETGPGDIIKYSDIPGVNFDSNVVEFISASIVYFKSGYGENEGRVNGFLVEKDISISNGETYSTTEQEAFEEEMDDMIDKASHTGTVIDVNPGSGGEFGERDLAPGGSGFEQVGGGYNPAQHNTHVTEFNLGAQF